eukprot:GHVS01029469.1.p1 GENE.GHVS01029469.1~~GHVS01029469.1.p1  ORF type:complete len:430 (+),score=150.33 GHVS01029469.1:108-1292(+)
MQETCSTTSPSALTGDVCLKLSPPSPSSLCLSAAHSTCSSPPPSPLLGASYCSLHPTTTTSFSSTFDTSSLLLALPQDLLPFTAAQVCCLLPQSTTTSNRLITNCAMTQSVPPLVPLTECEYQLGCALTHYCATLVAYSVNPLRHDTARANQLMRFWKQQQQQLPDVHTDEEEEEWDTSNDSSSRSSCDSTAGGGGNDSRNSDSDSDSSNSSWGSSSSSDGGSRGNNIGASSQKSINNNKQRAVELSEQGRDLSAGQCSENCYEVETVLAVGFSLQIYRYPPPMSTSNSVVPQKTSNSVVPQKNGEFCGTTKNVEFCGTTKNVEFCGITKNVEFCGTTKNIKFRGTTKNVEFCGTTTKSNSESRVVDWVCRRESAHVVAAGRARWQMPRRRRTK